ncbi:hypothetical protein GCM10028805_22090 [Spirosoma harenae]
MPRPALPASVLNSDQKKMIGISAAALLLGGSAWAVSKKISEAIAPESDDEGMQIVSKAFIELPEDIDVAGKVVDNMSFGQAFRAARNEVGVGGVFSWHGRWYNTFEKEEWEDLSLVQRQEYAEMIIGEKLPVKLYHPHATHSNQLVSTQKVNDPTVIEGYLNGQRVMGLDSNHDGIIDTVVMNSGDGHTYKVVDARGDNGLDTLYRYDPLTGEQTAAVWLDKPFILTNDNFSQRLEETMSAEIVDSILDADEPIATSALSMHDPDSEEFDQAVDHYIADTYEADSDTYVNNGDVHDMDE